MADYIYNLRVTHRRDTFSDTQNSFISSKIYRKDAQWAETNEKSVFWFLVVEIWSILYWNSEKKIMLRGLRVVRIRAVSHNFWGNVFSSKCCQIMVKKYSSAPADWIFSQFVNPDWKNYNVGAPIPPPLTEGPFNDMQAQPWPSWCHLSVAYDGNHQYLFFSTSLVSRHSA